MDKTTEDFYNKIRLEFEKTERYSEIKNMEKMMFIAKVVLYIICFFLMVTIPFSLFANVPIKEPSLELVSKSNMDSLFLDSDICCVYDFCYNDSLDIGVIIIRHKETGFQIGTIYGSPSKSFLKSLAEQFTPEYINDVMYLERKTKDDHGL